MGLNLAYVDDDENLRILYARGFAQVQYSCETFGSAEAFLKVAPRGRYDVLLLDIRLPGMSGADLLQELRRRGIFTPESTECHGLPISGVLSHEFETRAAIPRPRIGPGALRNGAHLLSP